MESAAAVEPSWNASIPWLKWPGGKRDMAPQLVAEILATKPRLYIEPFLGAGAVALALPPELPKVLADVNLPLIDCWRCVQKIPGALYAELCDIVEQRGDGREGYVAARVEFNRLVHHPRPMWARRAALFMYLNARCFNGLWRTNSKGLFNVPFGKREAPKHYDADELAAYTARLNRVDLRTGSYAKTIGEELTRRARGASPHSYAELKAAANGIALYADPPYDGTFDGYAEDGFTTGDQHALASTLSSAAAMGAAVWTTNSDTPLVRQLYQWAQISESTEHHSIGSKGERRGKRGCLLIRGGAARTDGQHG